MAYSMKPIQKDVPFMFPLMIILCFTLHNFVSLQVLQDDMILLMQNMFIIHDMYEIIYQLHG